MFYTDEAVNDLFAYSKILVDKINKYKNCSQQLRVLQYIIFAGMISYYGFEYVDTLYRAFTVPNFYYTSDSLDKIMNSQNLYDPSVQNFLNAGDVGAFVLIRFNSGCFGNLSVNRDIYVIEDKDIMPDELIEKIIHEINHIVNSVNNPICIKNGKQVVRNGLSVIGVDDSVRTYNMLEESVNVLQSADIMEHILGFTQYYVKDLEIKKQLDMIKYAFGSKREGLGYEFAIPTVRPLYLNPEFNKVLKRQRMVGKILPIKENFENKVGEGSYGEFCKSLDDLEASCNSFWSKNFYNIKAKTYVNAYNKL